MFKIIYATFCLLLTSLLIQGCAPIYKTNYIYHPVKSEKASHCANECLQHKQTCRSQCLDLQRQCEREARLLAIASDLINVQSPSNSNISSNRYELLNDCYKQAEKCELSCDEDHKLCHENCGGEVTVQTVCVKNCEKSK